MGMLVDGRWEIDGRFPTIDGHFDRPDSAFRNWVTSDGSSDFPAEAGRYHLYLAWACPWAHRAMIYRQLKGLENAISISIVDHFMGDQGWEFTHGPGCIPDTVNNAQTMFEIYQLADREFTGRVTVPVLWDKKTAAIVSNESADIIRMLNSAFDGIGGGDGSVDFYPADLASEIDAVNDLVYPNINNGVYMCGFAHSQAAYDQAFDGLFGALDQLEVRLATQRYLIGARITEADWRLFPTLVRFDAVYFGHFKCNLRRIVDYPNLGNYLRDLYQMPGIAETVNMDHTKRHYYASHETVNPTRIVPKGPELDFNVPHDRDRFKVAIK
jgi:putative glutathione S-transferase